MNKKLTRFFVFAISGTAALLSYQNCSKVSFGQAAQKADESSTALSTDPEGTSSQPTQPTQTTQPPPKNPSQSVDPRELDCGAKFVGASTAITYDSRVLKNPPAVDVTSADLSKGPNLDVENVNEVRQIPGDIRLTSAKIASITNLSGDVIDFNAQIVGQMNNFTSNRILMVTHRLGTAQGFNADFCISAQQIDSLGGMVGKLSVFGRNENGKKAVIKYLGQVSSFISLYDVEVQSPLNVSNYDGKLVNSHLVKIEGSQVDMTLYDSVIDEVSGTRGIIRLKGTSKVLKSDGLATIVKE